MGIQDYFNGENKRKNVIMLLAVSMLFVATISLTVWLSAHDDMTVLFSDLTETEIGEIAKLATENEIAYQVSEDGHAVLVPKDKVHYLRMKVVTGSTSFKNTVGFELFDDAEFGMTDFIQKINYQRALQGEIARTIMSLKEVRQARVHLVIPEKKLFDSEKQHAEAAVHLQLTGNTRLNGDQLVGIQKLVASAVPNLDVGDVSILDQSGAILTSPVRSALEQRLSTSLQMVKELESYLEDKANKILNRAYGKNNALALVDVEMDLRKVNITNEKVLGVNDNDKGVARKKISKKNQGQGKELKSKSQSEIVEIEYLNGKQMENINKEAGAIKRLTVAVLIPLQESIIDPEKIKKLISMAVGLNEARGDKISVQEIHVADGSFKTAAYSTMSVKPNSIMIDGKQYISENDPPVEEVKPKLADEPKLASAGSGPQQAISTIERSFLKYFNQFWSGATEQAKMRFIALYSFALFLFFCLIYYLWRLVVPNRLSRKERNKILEEIKKIVNAEKQNATS